MSATAHFAVADVRTVSELAGFSHAMPLVSAAVKRILELPHCRDAVRLLPALSFVHGQNTIGLMDIVYVGGGVLIDAYKNVDKVMHLLAGTTIAEGTAKLLDYRLHDHYAKWRQLLLVLHREAVGVEKEEREDLSTDVSIEDKLVWFKGVYHFAPKPAEYSGGQFAKALAQMGVNFVLDAKTDFRRAKPASGRRGEVSADKEKTAASERVTINSGVDVYNLLSRKFMTILLLFGDADLSKHKFNSNQRGVVLGTVRWLALEDVIELKTVIEGFKKLPAVKAEELADWFEGKLALAVKAPSSKTLSNAMHEYLEVLEGRIDARTAGPAKREHPDGGSSSTPVLSKKQKKAAKAAAKVSADAAAAGGAKPRTPDGKKPQAKKPQSELARKEGGNPDGPPCRKFAKGACVGPCRFSHEAAPDASVDEDEE